MDCASTAAMQPSEDRAGVPPGSPRVLCCIWGELRAIRATAESFRTCVLEPLHADALVFAQRQLEDDEDRLAFVKDTFGHRLIRAQLYDKPEPEDFFGRDVFREIHAKVRGNWLNKGNVQVLMNHVKLCEYLEAESILSSYDVFLFTRSDYLHLVPLPSPRELMDVVGPTDVLTQAGHEYGGINYNLILMRRSIVEDFLRAPRAIITSGKVVMNVEKTYNIERFWGFVAKEYGWLNLRMSITCFVTAEALGDRSTWRKIQKSDEHGVLYKYAPQMAEAYKSLELWQQQPEWRGFSPPKRLQVEESHGRARRPFALVLAATELKLHEDPAQLGMSRSQRRLREMHMRKTQQAECCPCTVGLRMLTTLFKEHGGVSK